MNLIKRIKIKFKTVYCNECENRMDEENFFGEKLCKAYPIKVNVDNSSLEERGRIEIIDTYQTCRRQKTNKYCFRYKKKIKE